MATTRYVYIVDDDVAFPVSSIDQYLKHMKKQPSIWGHAGHVRSTNPEHAQWIMRPRSPTIVDYANAAWFLETAWIQVAFLREPPRSKLTAEDMHLSYMVKKILGIETRVVGWRRDKHALSRYHLEMIDKTTLTPSIFAFRSYIVRSQAARGQVMHRRPTIHSLTYVDTYEQALSVSLSLARCAANRGVETSILCQTRARSLKLQGAHQQALVFTGLQTEQEQKQIKAIATSICCNYSNPPCAYIPHEVCGNVCDKMHFAHVSFFDLQIGRSVGRHMLKSTSRAYLAADALEAAATLFASLQIKSLFVPAKESLMRRMILQAAVLHKDYASPRQQFETVELEL